MIHDKDKKSEKFGKEHILVGGITAFLLLSSLLFMTLSLTSLQNLLSLFQGLVQSHHKDHQFVLSLLDRIQSGARIATVFYFVLCILSIIYRKSILTFFQKCSDGFYLFYKELLTFFKKEIFCKENTVALIVFCLIFIVGIALRLLYINQPIRSDEATILMFFAKKPLPVIMANYTNVGNHIFHTILLHFSWILFGDSLIAIRLPTLLAGIFLMPMVFLVVRYACGMFPALLATAFVATSSALIEYCVNARGYEIHAFLVITLLGLAQYLIFHPRNYFIWLLWGFASALGFWNLPTMLHAYGALTVWFFLNAMYHSNGLKPFFRGYFKPFFYTNLYSLILISMLYTPVLITFRLGHMDFMLNTTEHGSVSDLIPFTHHLVDLWFRNFPTAFQFIFLCIIPFGLFLKGQRFPFLSNILFCSVLWLLLISLISPIYGLNPQLLRIWLGHSLFLYIATAVGIAGFFSIFKISRVSFLRGSPFLFFTILLSILIVSVGSIQEYKHRYVYNFLPSAFQDAKPVAEYLKNHLKPGDLVLAPCPYGHTLQYQLEKQNIPFQIITLPNDFGQPQDFFVMSKTPLSALSLHKDNQKENQNENYKENNKENNKENKKVSFEQIQKQHDIYIIEGTTYKTMQEIIRESQIKTLANHQYSKVMSFSKATLYKIN